MIKFRQSTCLKKDVIFKVATKRENDRKNVNI